MKDFKFFADRPLAKYRTADSAVIILTILLWGIGMFTLYFALSGKAILNMDFSADASILIKKQFISSAIGFVFMAFFSFVDLNKIKKYIFLIVIVSIVLCICTRLPVIGIERNGAHRWIRIPFFGSFQPSEAVKFALVLYLSMYFAHENSLPKEERKTLPGIVMLFVLVGAVYIQNDFSSSAFIFVVGMAVFIISGAVLVWLYPLILSLLGFGILAVTLNATKLARVTTFLFGADDPDANYQIVHAQNAIINGGLFGQGFSSGLGKIFRVPELQSDCIFAAWGEAMGLAGVLVYFLILFLFAWRCFRIAGRTVDMFASFVVFGFTFEIVFQSLINIAVVSGALPATGIPLPFFSSGGSSIFITLSMCGMIVNASKYTGVEEKDEF